MLLGITEAFGMSLHALDPPSTRTLLPGVNAGLSMLRLQMSVSPQAQVPPGCRGVSP